MKGTLEDIIQWIQLLYMKTHIAFVWRNQLYFLKYQLIMKLISEIAKILIRNEDVDKILCQIFPGISLN